MSSSTALFSSWSLHPEAGRTLGSPCFSAPPNSLAQPLLMSQPLVLGPDRQVRLAIPATRRGNGSETCDGDPVIRPDFIRLSCPQASQWLLLAPTAWFVCVSEPECEHLRLRSWSLGDGLAGAQCTHYEQTRGMQTGAAPGSHGCFLLPCYWRTEKEQLTLDPFIPVGDGLLRTVPADSVPQTFSPLQSRPSGRPGAPQHRQYRPGAHLGAVCACACTSPRLDL